MNYAELKKEEQFLRGKFRSYYVGTVVDQPPDLQYREFGVGQFGRKISNRHLAFLSAEEFNKFLREETPFYVSYSGAYYRFPDRQPMQKKEFLRADLFYEFDADDLKTDCKQKHDFWSCKCGQKGPGNQESCPSCGEYVLVEQFVCSECLGEVKKQTLRLLDFLESDLGISKGISINFSGFKGYHLHVRSELVQNLTPSARIELVDYVTANGLDFFNAGFFKEGKSWICPTKEKAFGWSKRILLSLQEFLKNASPTELAVAGNLTVSTAKKILEKREAILNDVSKGFLFYLPQQKKTDELWKNLFQYLVDVQKLDIDRQTSIDIAKILRVPNTIHGGTGLLAKDFPLENLKEFNPLKDCVVFSREPVKVFVERCPEFEIGGEKSPALENQEADFPEFAAIFLIAKGLARLI